jgi:hypothetical protein
MKTFLKHFEGKFTRAFGILFSGMVILMLTHASLRARAINLSSENEKAAKNKSGNSLKKTGNEKTKMNTYSESRTLSEWRAFEVYHPSSSVTEDSLFHTFKKRQSEKEVSENRESDSAAPHTGEQILGAKSIIPILRSAFGDQVRGLSTAERDPYFMSHPTALFNPAQLKALCSNDEYGSADEITDICWKPRLSDEYLSALTDFAGDACPNLVMREIRNISKTKNKLVKSEEFNQQNLKAFANLYLRIPTERTTDEWLSEIVSESKRAIDADRAEYQENENTSYRAEDLYNMACQAVVLSKEFYTR